MAEINSGTNEKVSDRPTVVRNATDLQRLKLEKLMKNPDKPILLPEKPKERGMPAVPEFVRNVMGSSAGAGSGEFHVYRHLRRKEYARQKFMKEKGERERLEDEYHQKLEDNKRKADEKTAKKRAKRLKKKEKMKNKKKASKSEQRSSESEDSCNSESEEDNKDKTSDNEGVCQSDKNDTSEAKTIKLENLEEDKDLLNESKENNLKDEKSTLKIENDNEVEDATNVIEENS